MFEVLNRLLCNRSECPGDGVRANGDTGTCAEWANGLNGFCPGNIEIWEVDFRLFVAAFVRPWGRPLIGNLDTFELIELFPIGRGDVLPDELSHGTKSNGFIGIGLIRGEVRVLLLGKLPDLLN